MENLLNKLFESLKTGAIDTKEVDMEMFSILETLTSNDSTPSQILDRIYLNKDFRAYSDSIHSYEIYKNIAENTNVSQMIIDSMVDANIRSTTYDKNFDILECLIFNKNISSDNLCKIYFKLKDKYYHKNEPMPNIFSSLVRHIAIHRNTPSKVITDIFNIYINNDTQYDYIPNYNNDNEFFESMDMYTDLFHLLIYLYVLKSSNLPKEILNNFVDTFDNSDDMIVTFNTNGININNQMPIISYKKKLYFKTIALYNSNVDEEIIRKYFDYCTKSDTNKYLFPDNDLNKNLEDINKTIKYEYLLAISRNTNTPKDILEVLSKNNNSNIRISVAKNENTDPIVLKEMINRELLQYEKNIAHIRTLYNSNLSSDSIEIFFDKYYMALTEIMQYANRDLIEITDLDVDVLKSIACNPNTPFSTLEMMFNLCQLNKPLFYNLYSYILIHKNINDKLKSEINYQFNFYNDENKIYSYSMYDTDSIKSVLLNCDSIKEVENLASNPNIDYDISLAIYKLCHNVYIMHNSTQYEVNTQDI